MSGTRANRCLKVALATAILVVGSAAPSLADPENPLDDLLEACSVSAVVEAVPIGAPTVEGVASYSCGHDQGFINVTGCLQVDGAPVDCANDVDDYSTGAEAHLSAPCVPGLWTVVAVGEASSRLLPQPAISTARTILDCDPLVQDP
jgi:hypothetical protein